MAMLLVGAALFGEVHSVSFASLAGVGLSAVFFLRRVFRENLSMAVPSAPFCTLISAVEAALGRTLIVLRLPSFSPRWTNNFAFQTSNFEFVASNPIILTPSRRQRHALTFFTIVHRVEHSRKVIIDESVKMMTKIRRQYSLT